MRYEPAGDLIRKSSNDSARLEQEHSYLQALPSAVRRYFPALVSKDLQRSDNGQIVMEMDYVPFPNLAELFLHWRLGANSWNQIARRLQLIRNALRSCTSMQRSTRPNPELVGHGKLKRRISHWSNTHPRAKKLLA